MIDLFHQRFAQAIQAGTAADGVSTEAVFQGTSGDDILRGDASNDVFHLEDGGHDTAKGGGGADTFYLGGSFDTRDHIEGGPGAGGPNYDTVVLDGDYSGGLVLKNKTMTGIEWMTLTAGHDYDIIMNAHPQSQDFFEVRGEALGADDHLYYDGSLTKGGQITITGGAGADYVATGFGGTTVVDIGGGADTVLGGAGADIISASADAVSLSGGDGNDAFSFDVGTFGATTVIEGGAGDDRLYVYGGGAGGSSVVSGERVSGIESFFLRGGDIVFTGDVAHGQPTLVDAQYGGAAHFDASAEHADYSIYGSAGNDTLAGDGGDDDIFGREGENTLLGGGGDDDLNGSSAHDKLVGGLGQDQLLGGGGPDSFVFLSADDSPVGASDVIRDLTNVDTIDLKAIDADDKKAGNQAFHLVDAFTGHRGELALSYDKDSGKTALMGDTDGDGAADFQIQIDGKHADFGNFVL